MIIYWIDQILWFNLLNLLFKLFFKQKLTFIFWNKEWRISQVSLHAVGKKVCEKSQNHITLRWFWCWNSKQTSDVLN